MGVAVKTRLDSRAVEAVARRLQDLDAKAARKATRAGVNDATRLVLGAARKGVPQRSKRLKKSLGRRVKTYRGGRVAVGVVGPRLGHRVVVNGVPIDPAKYAHLVEFGRAAVRPKGKAVLSDGKTNPAGGGSVFGRYARAVPPDPFMLNAWRAEGSAALRALEARLRDAIARATLGAG